MLDCSITSYFINNTVCGEISISPLISSVFANSSLPPLDGGVVDWCVSRLVKPVAHGANDRPLLCVR